MKKIFASDERRTVLVANGINFAVDDELNFIFPNDACYKAAIKAFKKALVL